MLKDPSKKYRPYPPVALPDRQWPNRVLTAPPRWCSVDLRDGNQALAVPMNVSQKLELFNVLVKCGFKEIEVTGSRHLQHRVRLQPPSSRENRFPDDVWLQSARASRREDLIERTFQSARRREEGHHFISTIPRPSRNAASSSVCPRSRSVQVAVRGALR